VNAVDFIALMQAHIENLIKLQAVDLERASLMREAIALPAELAAVEAALAAAKRQSAAAADALSREETLRTRLESEAGSLRQKTVRQRAQLDFVTTPSQAEAMTREIEFAEHEVERLETDELTSMERTEEQDTAQAAALASVDTLAAAFAKTRDRGVLRQQEIDHALVSLNADREALRQAIEPEWLSRYDHLAKSRGTGLARAEYQKCNGCRMSIRPQAWNQLREGELLTCDNCGRLLYWDPSMTPAPEA
jgi:predicted  nucleic acid-binding Zn-ribbon protein